MFSKIQRGSPKQIKLYFESINDQSNATSIDYYKDTIVRDILEEVAKRLKLLTPL